MTGVLTLDLLSQFFQLEIVFTTMIKNLFGRFCTWKDHQIL